MSIQADGHRMQSERNRSSVVNLPATGLVEFLETLQSGTRSTYSLTTAGEFHKKSRISAIWHQDSGANQLQWISVAEIPVWHSPNDAHRNQECVHVCVLAGRLLRGWILHSARIVCVQRAPPNFQRLCPVLGMCVYGSIYSLICLCVCVFVTSEYHTSHIPRSCSPTSAFDVRNVRREDVMSASCVCVRMRVDNLNMSDRVLLADQADSDSGCDLAVAD